MCWTSGSAEASRSPLTVLRTSHIPAVGACCFPAISPPTLAADRSVSPLPPNYRLPGNRLHHYCHLPRVASQFGGRIPALPARQARSNHVTVRVQLKVTHPSNAGEIKPTKECTSKYIQINIQTEMAMEKVKNELIECHLYGKLYTSISADINANYDILHNAIKRAKNKHIHMPCKLIKFNKYKHKKSKWITQGLLKSIRSRDKLYARLKRLQPNKIEHNTLLINLKTYSNAARRYDDGCHVSRPLLLVACTFMAQDADATTACSSAVSTHVGVL